MWCYKIQYYDNGSYYNAQGVVAGPDMVDAITRLKGYYGEDTIEDIHMIATEGEYGIFDVCEFPNAIYTTFLPEKYKNFFEKT